MLYSQFWRPFYFWGSSCGARYSKVAIKTWMINFELQDKGLVLYINSLHQVTYSEIIFIGCKVYNVMYNELNIENVENVTLCFKVLYSQLSLYNLNRFEAIYFKFRKVLYSWFWRPFYCWGSSCGARFSKVAINKTWIINFELQDKEGQVL